MDGSEIVRVYPTVLVQVYQAGTSTLVAEVTTDKAGNFSIGTLPTGVYDFKVDGKLIKTYHHVRATHTHKADLPFSFFLSGSITADQDEVATVPVFLAPEAGSIVRITVTAENVDVTGDVTVHLLKGAKDGASALTVASNSIWSHQINPGVAGRRYGYDDDAPGLGLLADDVVTIGIDHVANTVAGLQVLALFRPDA